jgi:hypothetical protein
LPNSASPLLFGSSFPFIFRSFPSLEYHSKCSQPFH